MKSPSIFCNPALGFNLSLSLTLWLNLKALQKEHDEYNGMPKAIFDAGLLDAAAPATELGAELAKFIELGAKTNALARPAPPDAMRALIQVLLRKTGFAFDQYKDSTLLRRLERRMLLNKLTTHAAYAEFVEHSDSEADLLLKEMQISVTAFFRDETAFASVAKTIEAIVASKTPTDPIRVWVPGCATGEEAFSLAMLFAEALGDRLKTTDVQIFATDADLSAITHARISLYLESVMAQVPEDLRTRNFNGADGTYKVRALIRDMVVFAEHDLMRDPPFNRLDLVSCRNVLIYFKRSAQEHLLKSFHYMLNLRALRAA